MCSVKHLEAGENALDRAQSNFLLCSIKHMSDDDEYVDDSPIKIPSFEEVSRAYDAKWQIERRKFEKTLADNFEQAVRAYKSGKTQIHELNETPYSKHYIRAFRELFSDTGYQASVGELEKLGSSGGKRLRRLYITLPKTFT